MLPPEIIGLTAVEIYNAMLQKRSFEWSIIFRCLSTGCRLSDHSPESEPSKLIGKLYNISSGVFDSDRDHTCCDNDGCSCADDPFVADIWNDRDVHEDQGTVYEDQIDKSKPDSRCRTV